VPLEIFFDVPLTSKPPAVFEMLNGQPCFVGQQEEELQARSFLALAHQVETNGRASNPELARKLHIRNAIFVNDKQQVLCLLHVSQNTDFSRICNTFSIQNGNLSKASP
jgi:hypothetical protein